MAHRLVTAYREGRKAFPHTLLNPYAGMGDPTPSHACGGSVGNGPPRRAAAFPRKRKRIERLAAEIDALLD